MHVVSRFLRIFMLAEKQACKQLQCNKATLLEPASMLMGFTINRRAELEPAHKCIH